MTYSFLDFKLQYKSIFLDLRCFYFKYIGWNSLFKRPTIALLSYDNLAAEYDYIILMFGF